MNTLGEIGIQLFNNGSYGFLLLAILNQTIYFILLGSKLKRSEKYKFALDNVVKYLKRTANFFFQLPYSFFCSVKSPVL
jgi:hypothetical protein